MYVQGAGERTVVFEVHILNSLVFQTSLTTKGREALRGKFAQFKNKKPRHIYYAVCCVYIHVF